MSTFNKELGALVSSFRSDEAGTVTVFGIFAFAMLMIIGGIAIDGSNFWRHQQLMQQTADVAAHAGVVQIANSAETDEIKSAAADFVGTNMPLAVYGNLFADQSTDISLGHYDEATNTLSSTGKVNAVSVLLHRNSQSNNPIQTFALRVADIFLITEQTQLSEWNMTIRGVAVLAKLQGCNSTDGIYSEGELSLSSSNTIGPRYCLHSQDEVWMSQQNTFLPTAAVSMPDLATCGNKCTDSANPGTTEAAFERNFIMPDIGLHIENVRQSFLGTGGDPDIKDDFFFGKSLDSGALSVLQAQGIDTSSLSRGSVVTLTQSDFEALTNIPEGLVYDVTCTANGNGPNTQLDFVELSSSEPSTSEINNVAILTNCSLDFASGASVTSSVIISTRQASSATISASSGALIGDPLGGCDVSDKSVIMAMGDMHVPADFAGSNLSIVVDGNIHLSASSSSTTINHSGLSMFSSGEISIAAGHTFDSCALPPSGMTPELLVIRHVNPQLAEVTQ